MEKQKHIYGHNPPYVSASCYYPNCQKPAPLMVQGQYLCENHAEMMDFMDWALSILLKEES